MHQIYQELFLLLSGNTSQSFQKAGKKTKNKLGDEWQYSKALTENDRLQSHSSDWAYIDHFGQFRTMIFGQRFKIFYSTT